MILDEKNIKKYTDFDEICMGIDLKPLKNKFITADSGFGRPKTIVAF